MEITQKRVEDLIPYARNSRTHSDEQVAQIAASIKEFGFNNPVLVDGDSGIIAGHGRVLAARKLGLEQVPCVELSHLTDTQKRAYIIADNKLALNAGWDDEMLKLEIKELGALDFDIELLGFDDDDISKLLDEFKGISIDVDNGSDEAVDIISVRFLPCDRAQVINAINDSILRFKSAYITCEKSE